MDDLNIKQLLLAVSTIAQEKNLPEETVINVIEMAIAAAWRRDNGERDWEVRSELDINKGTAEVFVGRTVVEDDDLMNEATEITLTEARKIKSDAELEDLIEEKHEVTTFGRVAAQTAKQVVIQRLREAEREIVLGEFEDKIGTIVSGNIVKVDPRVVRIELGKATGILPQREQIQGEYYSVGSRIRVYIKDIEREGRGPQLILSRGCGEFVESLFKQEVPEIETGAVSIKGIAREAGRRTKLAVASAITGIDPVGTFVGGHGTRVQAVMNEIGSHEKIDIIPFSEDIEEFIAESMNPAEVVKVEITDEEKKKAKVFVEDEQQSIAIGRGGQNVRLASMLTGYDLDIEVVEKPQPEVKPKKNIEDSLFGAIEESSEE